MWLLAGLSVFWLLLFGLVIIHTTRRSAGMETAPRGYQNAAVQFILNMAFALWLVVAVVLLFLDWRVFLALLFGGTALGKAVLWPVSERLIMFPLFALFEKRASEPGNGP